MNIVNNFKVLLINQYVKLYPRDIFVGVTGSVDRVVCLQACQAVLAQKYKTLLALPTALWKLNPSFKKVVLDMGIKQKEEMDFFLSIIKPKTAIFTKISYEYCDKLGGLSEIVYEMGKLLDSLDQSGQAIFNWDDQNSRKLAEHCKGSVIYYGSDPQNCTIWAGNPKIENFATTFELNLGVERVKINFQLLGLNRVYCALAAAALGIVYGVPLTKIKLALESIEPLEHSLQVVVGPNGSILLDDTVSSSPAALEDAIDTMLTIPARRRVLVLGEMRGLGKYSEELHRQAARRIYKEKLDLIFLGQEDVGFTADELNSLGFWEERLDSNLTNSQLVGKLLKTLGKGDVCLIQGSKEERLDEVIKRIAKKQ